MSFIPYVGSLVVLILSIASALVEGWPNLKLLFMALAIVVTGQFLEGYVISPKLVGEFIGLHPVWLMFALLAFGQLFGFVGLVIAVPTAAAVGVIARHLIGLYLASPFYRGSPATANDDAPAPADPRFAASGELRTRGLSSGGLEPRGHQRHRPLAGMAGQDAAPGGARRIGKSHLAACWAKTAVAATVHGKNLGEENARASLQGCALLIEDADLVGDREERLFHLVNSALQTDTSVLLTARQGPDAWGLKIPDIVSTAAGAGRAPRHAGRRADGGRALQAVQRSPVAGRAARRRLYRDEDRALARGRTPGLSQRGPGGAGERPSGDPRHGQRNYARNRAKRRTAIAETQICG